jgi:hypothetical protein
VVVSIIGVLLQDAQKNKHIQAFSGTAWPSITFSGYDLEE